MSDRPFARKSHAASNIAIAVALLAAGNFLTAKLFGQPWLYCAIAQSPAAAELYGLYRLGLVGVIPLAVIGVLKGNKEGLGLLALAILYGGLPLYLDTLFNVPPGCVAS